MNFYLSSDLPEHKKIFRVVRYSFEHDLSLSICRNYHKRCGDMCVYIYEKLKSRWQEKNWKIGIWHRKDRLLVNGKEDYHAFLYHMTENVIYDPGADLTIGNVSCYQIKPYKPLEPKHFCFESDNPDDYVIEYMTLEQAKTFNEVK